MTNDFAIPTWNFLVAAVLVAAAAGPCMAEPPFVQPDLVIRRGAKQKGENRYEPVRARPLIVRRRNKRPVFFDLELNGDTMAAATRRDVEVSIIGPRKHRRADIRYFFEGDNITGSILIGAFSGYVDPGINFGDLEVEMVPKKRNFRRNRNLGVVTIRAVDADTGNTIDSVRGKLQRR